MVDVNANLDNWKPASPQQEAFLNSPADIVMFGGAAGGGKMLRLDELLPTPSGWVKNGDLAVGDELFAENGTVARVTRLFDITIPTTAYRLIFDDGSEIDAGGEHQWLTLDAKELAQLSKRTDEYRARRRATRPSRVTGHKSAKFTASLVKRNGLNRPATRPVPTGTVRTTQEIYDTVVLADGRTNHAIPVAKALELPAVDLLVDPYVLGAWLGDGSRDGGRFSGIDPEIWQEIEKAGYRVTHSLTTRAAHYIIGLVGHLRSLGVLFNKHVPARYLRGSRAQRLALLQGLMDTDGTVCESGVEFTNTNKAIIDAAHELIVSLGWKASIRKGLAKFNGHITGPVWDIRWTPSDYVFRLPRKRNTQKLAVRRTTKFRYIVDCVPVTPTPMRCIQVDSPSHLFLAGRSMVPTHNSEVLLVDAAAMYDTAGYHAVLFRRTYPELAKLIERSQDLYGNLGGTYNVGDRMWRWPWGSTIEFKYLDKDNDVYKRQGFEWQYAGWDESTHFLDKTVRYIIHSRMRSPQGLRMRVRLATNPGNRGSSWHMGVFIGPKCPHCLALAGITTWPKTSRVPYHIYNDAKWPDGTPVGRTTQFIPSKVTDHSIFVNPETGVNEYVEQGLKGLPTALRQALMDGCWAAFEGQYFDVFDHSVHVLEDRQILGERQWWPYWVGIDYGFSMTHLCCAYLFTKDPVTGRVYTLEEYTARKRKAIDVATDLQDLWGGYNVKAWYLSPDAFDHDGTADFSRAELMDQATGLGFDKAYNERIGGAMLMYQLLANNEWYIMKDCELLVASIPTRVHDEERRSEDVLKVEADEDDSYDAARYGLASHINPGRRPISDLIQERVGLITDPTSAMMQYNILMNQAAKRGKPIIYRGGRRNR